MKIFIIVICVSILWVVYEMYTAPLVDEDEKLKDYESDNDAIF